MTAKPKKVCTGLTGVRKHRVFWKSPGDNWTCTVCHPPKNQGFIEVHVIKPKRRRRRDGSWRYYD